MGAINGINNSGESEALRSTGGALHVFVEGGTSVSGTSNGLTDAQLRASAVPVSGSASVGSAPTSPPLSVSGLDPSGNKQHIRLDRESNLLASSLRNAFRDDFNGSSLNAANWQVLRNDPGQAITLSGGELSINAGTTAGEQTIIRSLAPLSIPVRTWYLCRLSQRIANQEFYLELVNQAGDMTASWKLDGVVASNAKYIATNGGNGSLSAAVTVASSASDTIYEIEMFADECYFVNRNIDSTSAKGYSQVRHTNVPDPNGTYYAQIRVVNLGVAPASPTTLTLGAVAIQDINELTAEVTGGRGDAVGSKSISAYVLQGASQLSAGGNSGWLIKPDNANFTDIASSAISSTTTSSAISPSPYSGAAEFVIPVTAVSGTNPTLDVAIEESDDTGTNWYRIYEFPRIAATGAYRTPVLQLSGNRIRYVRTVGGTSPSFTMSLVRNTHVLVTPPPLRQQFDRSVSLTTLNATTGTLKTGGARNVQMVINLGAATTPPTVQMEGSDDNGASWYIIGSALAGVANSTVQISVADVHAEMIRGRVSVVGSGVTPGYVLIKAHGF